MPLYFQLLLNKATTVDPAFAVVELVGL